MQLVYQPEGSDEPQRWKYDPKKLMSAEREMLERRTGRDFSDFTTAVIKGNSSCRRALLFMFLKRDHPGVRYEDVDFAWGELKLQHSRAELELIRQSILDNAPPDQQAAMVEGLDRQIAEAHDDAEDSGKAELPIAD